MFTDSLEIGLELTIEDETVTVDGGMVKALNLRMEIYGFEGEIEFWVCNETKEDPLFEAFITDKLIELFITVQAHILPDDAEPAPIELEAMGTGKTLVKEMFIENVLITGDPVLYRYYRIRFADSGRVLWKQHYPCDLLVDGTVMDLIDANSAGIPITMEWDPLQVEAPINLLPGHTHVGCASFYDFLIWLADTEDGGFFYDYAEQTYSFSEEKPESDEEPIEIDRREIETLTLDFPETRRFNDRYWNTFTDSPDQKVTEREEAYEGVFRDSLKRMEIASSFDNAFQKKSDKNINRGYQVILEHKMFPTVLYVPGEIYMLKDTIWSQEIIPAGEEYRLRIIDFDCRAVSDQPDIDKNLEYATYNVTLSSLSELKASEVYDLPAYVTPKYPVMIEGKIKSEQGEEEDVTYQFYENEDTAVESYRVVIPAFVKDDEPQEIVAPFEPLYSPGNFYFPAYKDERVVVAIGFHSAVIERFVDYRVGARLPMETQGNHLLMGKSETSKTSLQHVYVDDIPEFSIEQTHESDQTSIVIKEGSISLEIKEAEDEGGEEGAGGA